MLQFSDISINNGLFPLRDALQRAQPLLISPLSTMCGRIMQVDWPYSLTTQIKQRWISQGTALLNMSATMRQHYVDSRLYPAYLNVHNTNNPLLYGQIGVFAKRDLPALWVLGAYGGRYLRYHRHLAHEFKCYGQKGFERYLFSADPIKQYTPFISGLHSENAITLVNDCRPADKSVARHADITCRPVLMRWIWHTGWLQAVFYVTVRAIKQHQEILTDYGDKFWGD